MEVERDRSYRTGLRHVSSGKAARAQTGLLRRRHREPDNEKGPATSRLRGPRWRYCAAGGLQRVDVSDEIAHGDKPLGLAEVDLAGLLQVADELDHVQRVDTEGLEVASGVTVAGSMSRLLSRTPAIVSIVAMN